MGLLSIEQASKAFGGLLALNAVSFEVHEGEILGLIGPNGAGKTTLFHLVTGLDRLSAGRILLGGTRIDGFPPHRIARQGIARTFQIVRVFPQLTVLQNVMVGRHSHTKAALPAVVARVRAAREEEEEIRRSACGLLSFVGLDHRLHDHAGTLPHGQQRLVEIARALATRPRLLLLDEPAAGLNPLESARLKETIAAIRRDLAVTVLIIEHDMRLLMNVSDRVVVLDHGRKIAEGLPSDVRSDPAVITAYLGEGYLRAHA